MQLPAGNYNSSLRTSVGMGRAESNATRLPRGNFTLHAAPITAP